MKINFIYSLNSELNRVLDAYKREETFTKFGYQVYLPEGFDIHSKNHDNLTTQIKKEFDSSAVNDAKEDILKNWKKYKKELNSLLDQLEFNIPDVINVVLTKYGVGGSYWPPDKIIINVHYKKYFENFTHELIHCSIEKSVVNKYKLGHATKEGVVDWIFINNLFLNKIFPDYNLQRMTVLPSEELVNKSNLKVIVKNNS